MARRGIRARHVLSDLVLGHTKFEREGGHEALLHSVQVERRGLLAERDVRHGLVPLVPNALVVRLSQQIPADLGQGGSALRGQGADSGQELRLDVGGQRRYLHQLSNIHGHRANLLVTPDHHHATGRLPTWEEEAVVAPARPTKHRWSRPWVFSPAI